MGQEIGGPSGNISMHARRYISMPLERGFGLTRDPRKKKGNRAGPRFEPHLRDKKVELELYFRSKRSKMIEIALRFPYVRTSRKSSIIFEFLPFGKYPALLRGGTLFEPFGGRGKEALFLERLRPSSRSL